MSNLNIIIIVRNLVCLSVINILLNKANFSQSTSMENYFLNMELFWPASIWRLSHAEIFQGGKQKNPKNYNFQNTSLGLFRSDYFYCCDSQRIKQVEFNTIASSFGALSARLVLAQKLVMIHSGQKWLLADPPSPSSCPRSSWMVPKNYK